MFCETGRRAGLTGCLDMMYAALCKPPPLYAWGNDSISVTVLTINKAVNIK